MRSFAKLSYVLVFGIAITLITFGAVLAQEGVH